MKLINVNAGMTHTEAAEVGSRNSWMGTGTMYFDPIAEAPLDLGDVVAGSSVLSVPAVSASVAQWEKDGLIRRQAAGEIQGNIRDTRSRYGDPKEWDHISITLTRDESATLKELGPDVQARFVQVVSDVLRQNPADEQSKRQAFVSKMHDSSGNLHFHVLSHRHSIKQAPDGTLQASTSIDMTRNSEIQSVVQKINQALYAAELGQLQIREAGVGEADVFANRGDAPRNPAQTDDQAPNRGPDPGQSILEQARNLTPSSAAIKRMVELQSKKVADAQKDLEESQRALEGFQNLLAAEVQKNEALKEAEIAKAQAEVAEAARFEAEMKAEIAANEAKVSKENEVAARRLADAATAEAEAFEKRLHEANAQIGDLQDTVENNKAEIEQRDETITELQAEVDRIPTLEAENDALTRQMDNAAKALRTKEAEAKTAADALAAERAARAEDAAKAEKAQERSLASLRTELEAAAKMDLANAREKFVERLEAINQKHSEERNGLQKIIDGLREQVSTLTQAVSAPIRKLIAYRQRAGLSTADADMTDLRTPPKKAAPQERPQQAPQAAGTPEAPEPPKEPEGAATPPRKSGPSNILRNKIEGDKNAAEGPAQGAGDAGNDAPENRDEDDTPNPSR